MKPKPLSLTSRLIVPFINVMVSSISECRGSRLGRLRKGSERIGLPELRFDGGAPDGRRRRQLSTQLVALLLAVPASTDFRGVRTSAHDELLPNESGL